MFKEINEHLGASVGFGILPLIPIDGFRWVIKVTSALAKNDQGLLSKNDPGGWNCTKNRVVAISFVRAGKDRLDLPVHPKPPR